MSQTKATELNKIYIYLLHDIYISLVLN